MKKTTKYFNSNFIAFAVFAVIVMVVFEAFNIPFYADDPNIDRLPWNLRTLQDVPPRPNPYPMVFTTSDGFDNFDNGQDLGEVSNGINPANPIQMFALYNASGSAGVNGHNSMNGYSWGFGNPGWGSTMFGDPVVAYDSLGNLFLDNMSGSGATITGTRVARSTNNGTTFTSVAAGNNGNDKNWLAADQTGGPYANYIYGTMTNTSVCSFMRSTDHGATFNVTNSLSPHGLPGAMVCVGPNGAVQGGCVYVVTNAGSSFSATYTFHRSTDGGTTFTNMGSQNFANYVGTNVGGRNSVNNMRTRPYPMISADNSYGPNRGRLYLVYASNNPSGDGNKPDVYCRYSTDQGATWSAAVTVNDDPSSTNNNQWHPSCWCDKTNGKLYVMWMDSRNFPTADSCEMYGTFSTNGGTSFLANQKLSNGKMKVDCSTCPGGGTPRYQGDYNGICSNPVTSLSSWTDFRYNTFSNFSAYLPDFAFRQLSAAPYEVGGVSDSAIFFVTIPAVKLYTDKVKFSSLISAPPAAGTITVSFLNKTSSAIQDSVTTYPDSVRCRIKTSGGVTDGVYTITILAKGPNGTPVHARDILLLVDPIGIRPISTEIPKQFSLFQNYPNPFNPTTNIRFDMPKAGNVKITVFDIAGKEVAIAVNGNYNAGKYSVDFDATNLASSVYFYKIDAAEFTSVKKMILIK